MRCSKHLLLSVICTIISLSCASPALRINTNSVSTPTTPSAHSASFLISLLRQSVDNRQATSACPNSPGICDPATSVCCPGSNLCCPLDLPVCLQPAALNLCADADGKTLCGVDPDGSPIKGTLCILQSDICCPDPEYSFCTADAPGACVNENGFISCGVANPLPGVDCGDGACCQDPQRCCEIKGSVGCCDPDEPGVFGAPRDVENFPITGVEGEAPGVVIPPKVPLPGEQIVVEPTPSSSPGVSPIPSPKPLPSPVEPSPVELPSPPPAQEPVDPGQIEVPIDGPDDGTEQTPDDGTEQTPDDGTEQTPDDGTEQTPDDGTEQTPDDGTEQTPDEESKDIDPITSPAPGQSEQEIDPITTDEGEGEEAAETDEEEASPTAVPSPDDEVDLNPEGTADEQQEQEVVGPVPGETEDPLIEEPAPGETEDPTIGEPIMESMEPSAEAGDNDEDSEDDGSVCWPASATVELENGDRVAMKDVKVGMRVRVAGGNTFSEVFGWTHKDDGYRGRRFVRIGIQGGQNVVASVGHMMYRRRCEARVCEREMVEIEKMEKGDEMWMVEDGREVVKMVERVGRVRNQGLYNPQTVHGDIVVDDVVATCYTKYVPHKVAHGLLAPIRALYEWTGLGFCVSV